MLFVVCFTICTADNREIKAAEYVPTVEDSTEESTGVVSSTEESTPVAPPEEATTEEIIPEVPERDTLDFHFGFYTPAKVKEIGVYEFQANIWNLLLLMFGFDIIKFFDTKIRKIFRRVRSENE